MPPVYIAAPNNSSPISSFVEKGISHLMPGTVADATISGYRWGNIDTAYQIILQNLGAFSRAQIERNVLLADGNAFYNALKQVKNVPTFDAPIVECNFPSLSNDQKETLRGFNMHEITNTKYQGSPSFDVWGSIMAMGVDDQVRVTPGSVSVDGYFAYICCTRAMKLFSFFSGYNVRKTDSNFTLVQRFLGSGPSELTDKQEFQPWLMNQGEGLIRKNLRTLTESMGEVYCNQTAAAVVAIPANSSMMIPNRHLTPDSEVDSDGLFFPYFEGMNLPDRTFAATVFQRIFFKCIGDSVTRATANISRVRSGLRQLSHMKAGLCITHAFCGINLAENSNTMIRFVIADGRYRGFVLLGSNFGILYRNKVIDSVDKDQLNLDLASLDEHAKALIQIASTLSMANDAGGDSLGAVSPSDINTSRKLANAIQLRKKSSLSGDIWVHIYEQVRKTSFGDSFGAVTTEKISAFLSYVQTGDISMLAAYPAFLHLSFISKVLSGTVLTDTLDQTKHNSRILFGLMIFGPQAPSLNYGTAKDRLFNLPSKGDDANLEVVDGKRRLQYLPFATRPIFQALDQWNSLFEKGAFRLPEGKRGSDQFVAKTSYSFVISGVDFTDIYEIIREIAGVLRIDAKTGNKRKVGATEVDEQKRKKAKVIAEDAMDI